MRWRKIISLLVALSVLAGIWLLGSGRVGEGPSLNLAELTEHGLAAESAPNKHDAAPTMWAAWARQPRVGLQVGHWNSDQLPDELARLRKNTGTAGGGYTELQVNMNMATLVKERLEEAGVIVDLLPATVPIRYQADAFVSIHADGSHNTEMRGWKLGHWWQPSVATQDLAWRLGNHYGALGIPYDHRVTANMRGYYAFNRSKTHAIASTTPGVILELGFLTNAEDRRVMTEESERLADAIAAGLLDYLRAHDPHDADRVAEPLPLAPVQSTQVITAYSAPWDTSKPVRTIHPTEFLEPIDEVGGWYKVPLPPYWNRIAWVRTSEVIPARQHGLAQ